VQPVPVRVIFEEKRLFAMNRNTYFMDGYLR
jgi:hypothetical protein